MLNPVLYGGCTIAQLYHAAQTHFKTDPAVVKCNQPDVLNLHAEFLDSCNAVDSIITVTTLRIGAIVSSFQLSLSQKDKVKVIALVASTNFDTSLGPSGESSWKLLPPPPPRPNIDTLLAQKAEENWVPFTIEGEVLALSRRFVTYFPRSGFNIDGACDYWMKWQGEPLHTINLTILIDSLPSMADTMLRTNSVWDGHAVLKSAAEQEDKNPGKAAVITQTWKDVFKSKFFPITLTLDLEFKRRLPEEGLRIVQIRQQTKKLDKGRLDFESILHDENGNLVCTAKQVQFILPSTVKLKTAESKKKEKSLL